MSVVEKQTRVYVSIKIHYRTDISLGITVNVSQIGITHFRLIVNIGLTHYRVYHDNNTTPCFCHDCHFSLLYLVLVIRICMNFVNLIVGVVVGPT
jgi:hypothetical protein